MAKVSEVCMNPDTAALVIFYLAEEIVVEDPMMRTKNHAGPFV